MPTLAPNEGKLVLVTGANGYIAMWIIQTLLQQGYQVRGTVRSEQKGKHLKEVFGSFKDKFDIVIVEDFTKEGAFDEAVKGVDAIEHTASPLPADVDAEALIKPAVQGTLGILNSVLKFGDNVKRIVITSSLSAIISVVDTPTVFDETCWGDSSVELLKEQGVIADARTKYRASKTLSERAAWDFYNAHKGKVEWDLVVLNPSWVLGPPVDETDTNFIGPGSSNGSLLGMISQEKPENVLKSTYGNVHIIDLALAHVLALQKEGAAGERIIISNRTITYQATRDFLFSIRPEIYMEGILPRGDPTIGNTPLFDYNIEKSAKVLGLKLRSTEETIKNAFEFFEKRGILPTVSKR